MNCKLFFLVIGTTVIFACQSETNKSNQAEESSTKRHGVNSEDVIRKIIRDYSFKEKAAMDSVQFFGLEAVFNDCLKLLYVVYGKEKVMDVDKRRDISIGECDIRIYKFKYVEPNLRRLDFEVFFRDSLPVNALFNFEKLGSMNNSFTIDIKKKEIVNASNGGTAFTSIKDFRRTMNGVTKDTSFKSYVENNWEVLHPKFKVLFLDYRFYLPNR